MFKKFALGIALVFALCSASFAQVTGQQARDQAGQVVNGANGNAYVDASGVSATITNLALTTNVVTITATHSYVVGQTVKITLATGPTLFADCNGTFVVVSVSTTVSFTYALTHADIVSGAATGTCNGFFESPIAAGTTVVSIVAPKNAMKLFVTTSAICAIQATSGAAAGTGGSYNTVAATIYELYVKPGDTTIIARTNSSIINFRYATLH